MSSRRWIPKFYCGHRVMDIQGWHHCECGKPICSECNFCCGCRVRRKDRNLMIGFAILGSFIAGSIPVAIILVLYFYG